MLDLTAWNLHEWQGSELYALAYQELMHAERLPDVYENAEQECFLTGGDPSWAAKSKC